MRTQEQLAALIQKYPIENHPREQAALDQLLGDIQTCRDLCGVDTAAIPLLVPATLASARGDGARTFDDEREE